MRLGAGISAIVLAVAFLLNLPWLAVLVGVNLGVSAFFGTKLFLPGRAWPIVKRTLKLGPTELEHEYPPRFAQVLGSVALILSLVAFAAGATTLAWGLALAVFPVMYAIHRSYRMYFSRMVESIHPQVLVRAAGAGR